MFPPSMLTLHTSLRRGATPGPTLPLWVLRLDWSEFLRDPASQRDLLQIGRHVGEDAAGRRRLDEIEAALAAAAWPRRLATMWLRFGIAPRSCGRMGG